MPMGKTLFINVPHMHALILTKGWFLKRVLDLSSYRVFGGPISFALDWPLFNNNNRIT